MTTRWRGLAWQMLVVGVVLAAFGFLVATAIDNLSRMGIATGFRFLAEKTSFEIGETIIPFHAGDSYFRAFLVGIVNTLRVAVLGIVLATLIGIVVGIARLSANPLVAKLARLYVEIVRNIPLLLQLLFWHTAITTSLPAVRQAWHPLPGLYLSNRGLAVPLPALHPVYLAMLAAFACGGLAAILLHRRAERRRLATGDAPSTFWPILGLVLGLPIAVFLVGGAPLAIDMPVLAGFNLRGGATVSPEFAAVLLGLAIYTSAYIAETVRSGILGVAAGQSEAARTLGLRQGAILRLVVLPQALRIVVPPLTNQYLSLTKSSSLAVAVGYPELVRVAYITMGETGQAIEAVVIIIAVYLTMSLATAVLMNLYNSSIALVER
jgi:general L-amino acid transport system permease protein